LRQAEDEYSGQVPSNLLTESMIYLASSNNLHSMQLMQLHYPKLGRPLL
jgi:hypothetical protein